MAIKEIRREWSPCHCGYVKTFLCHSEADVTDLPQCCEGSKAIVSETDNEYICTGNGWVNSAELPEDGGNNGGGSSSGGASVFRVNFTIDPETFSVIEDHTKADAIADVSFAECREAIKNGFIVQGVENEVIGEGSDIILPVLVNGEDAIVFLVYLMGKTVEFEFTPDEAVCFSMY